MVIQLMWRLFPGTPSLPDRTNTSNNPQNSSPSTGCRILTAYPTDTFPLLAFFEIFNLLPFEDIIGKYLPSLIFSFATSTCCNWVIYEPAASRESIRRLSGVFYEIEHPFLVPIKALFGLYPNNDS
jgi:hypothetical protein